MDFYLCLKLLKTFVRSGFFLSLLRGLNGTGNLQINFYNYLIMFNTQRYSDIVKAEEEQKHGRVAVSNVDML